MAHDFISGVTSNTSVFSSALNGTDKVSVDNGNSVAFKAVQAFLLVSFMLIGIIGNTFLCAFIGRTREMRTFVNIFYISLAVANIGVAGVCIPFTLSSIFVGKWALGEELCYINGIANPFWVTACCYSVTAMTIHKFILVTRPMKHLMTLSKVYLMVCVVWLASAIVIIWPILKSKQIVYKPVAGHCGYSISERQNEAYYLIFLVCAVLICPTIINVYCYVRMFRVLNVHRERIKRSSVTDKSAIQTNKRNIVTLYVVFVIFFITWLPSNVYSIFYITGNADIVPDWVLALAYVCAYSICAQVPVIVIYRSEKLKNEFKGLLRCLFTCNCCADKRQLFNEDAVDTEWNKQSLPWIITRDKRDTIISFTYENRTFDESKL